MNITKEQIKKLKPCPEVYQWFIKHGSLDLTKTLLDVNKVKPEWAAWLYTRLMNGEQRKQFAIHAAEQVLHIFEAEYPDDKRPRKAIAAAKKVLKSNTRDNRDAAYDAAYDAGDAADAAYDAAYDAADAADAAYAAYAAYAAGAAGAAYAAYAAYAAGAGAAGAAGAYGAYAAAAAGDAAVDAAAAAAGAGAAGAYAAAAAAGAAAAARIAMRGKLIVKAIDIVEKK